MYENYYYIERALKSKSNESWSFFIDLCHFITPLPSKFDCLHLSTLKANVNITPENEKYEAYLKFMKVLHPLEGKEDRCFRKLKCRLRIIVWSAYRMTYCGKNKEVACIFTVGSIWCRWVLYTGFQ